MKKNILLLLFAFTFFSCSDSNDTLLEKLQAAVEAKEAGAAGYNVVALGELTDFEWDKLYFFSGEVEPKEMADQIGIKWEGKSIPGGHNRLLFVHQNQVVSYVDYNEEEFPLRVFGCNTDRWEYPRARSRFATFKYCQNDEEVYAFIPEQCIANIQELKNNKCPEEGAAK